MLEDSIREYLLLIDSRVILNCRGGTNVVWKTGHYIYMTWLMQFDKIERILAQYFTYFHYS